MDQFNSRNDDDEHFRAVAHDLHDLHAQTNPQILAEKLHKFFVKHSGLHPDQARNVVEGMFQKAGHATRFADGGPVDKALNVIGQQQADPVAVAKQVASMPPVRQLSPMGLYSHGAETAAALPQAKGSPQQMKAMLKGVKQEELAGYDDAFAGKKSVTKDEIAQHFRDQMPVVEETVLGGSKPDLAKSWETVDRLSNDLFDAGITEHAPIARGTYDINLYPLETRPAVEELAAVHRNIREQSDAGRTLANTPTKFQQYTLPGGENYREVLLKMPEMAWQGPEKGFQPTSTTFRSSHWDDPNVLAHLRMADRTGPNGEKILHVEEIQSDWGQKGKKEGFAQNIDPKIMEQAQEKLDDASNALRNHLSSMGLTDIEMDNALATARSGRIPSWILGDPRNEHFGTDYIDAMRNRNDLIQTGKPPSAPYVTNTQAWTDLALKRALREAAEGGYDKLVWTPGVEQAKRYSLTNTVSRIGYEPATGELYALDRSGAGIPQIERRTFKPEELPGVIGKDATEKLLSTEPNANGLHVLNDQEIPIGGEGMKGYYDKIVPKRLQEIIKRHDPSAKVGYTDVMLPPKAGVGHNNPPFEAPGLTITPKMRESILRGQPAFKRGGAIPLHPALNIPGVHIRTAEAGEPFFHGEK